MLRIGVTGLSRAGKTVFITSLVANLLDRGRMQALRAAADGTIRAADLIVVMEAGRVVEQGTHDQLMEQGGAYAALVRLQFGGE